MFIKINKFIIITALINCIGTNKSPAVHYGKEIEKDQGAWLKDIPNSMLLRDLSLPGTHESLALFKGSESEHEKLICQSLDLLGQLRSGIRVLDIRCGCVGNQLLIYHKNISQSMSFTEVVTICNNYLNSNPTEAIFMIVEDEHPATDCTGHFGEIFQNVYWDNHEYSDHFWRLTNNSLNLRLGDVRNKIVIIQNFHHDHFVGLPYEKFADIQNHLSMKSNWDLYDKWTQVKAHLIKANSLKHSPIYFMNYLSVSDGATPYFVASGHTEQSDNGQPVWTGMFADNTSYPDFPRIDGFIYFEGTNVLTYNWINENHPTFVGIIMADFPGEGLISEIIARNIHHMDSIINLSTIIITTQSDNQSHGTANLSDSGHNDHNDHSEHNGLPDNITVEHNPNLSPNIIHPIDNIRTTETTIATKRPAEIHQEFIHTDGGNFDKDQFHPQEHNQNTDQAAKKSTKTQPNDIVIKRGKSCGQVTTAKIFSWLSIYSMLLVLTK